MSAFFYFIFYVVEHYHGWSKRQKPVCTYQWKTACFWLKNLDSGENSKFGIMCMNEIILKISKEKNESSSSFFVKLV